MEVDNALRTQIEAAFGKCSLYAILGVERTAAPEEIKRGYRRMALKMHPDKGGDAEQFKALSVVHAILSDEAKRKAYDTTGEIDTHEMSADAEVWYDYFRNLFPKVTVDKIEEFSKTYKESEEERNDIIKYYNRYEGDFNSIMDSVMLTEEEDNERIACIIRDCLSTGELGQHATRFDSTSSRYAEKYRLKVEKEKKAASSGKKKKSVKNDDSEALLQQMIQNNTRRRGGESAFAAVLEKYAEPASSKRGGAGKKKQPTQYDDISDEAFEAAQARISSKKKRKS